MFSFYVPQIGGIDVQNRDIDSNPSFFKDLEVEGIYISSSGISLKPQFSPVSILQNLILIRHSVDS